MKIIFEDESYLKIEPSKDNPKEYSVTICARDSANPNNVTILSVGVDKIELLAGIDELKKEV